MKNNLYTNPNPCTIDQLRREREIPTTEGWIFPMIITIKNTGEQKICNSAEDFPTREVFSLPNH